MAMKLLIKPLEAKSLSVESKPLFTPPLESLKEVLEKGLKANFDEVDVNVVTSPDLTQEPFNLASEGKSIWKEFESFLNPFHSQNLQEFMIYGKKNQESLKKIKTKFSALDKDPKFTLQDYVEIPKFLI